MLPLLAKVDLSSDDEKRNFVLYWLERPKSLIKQITDTREFQEEELLWLIKTEIQLYGRRDLLYRLSARYNKLRRHREWKEIQEVLDGKKAIR